jgi:phage-related protein
MSQPIDRAYVEILPDFDDFEASAKRQITNELRSVGREAEKAGDQVEESFRDSGKQAEKAFQGIGREAEKAFDDIEDGAKRSEKAIVDVNGRLHDSRGRFLAMGKEAGDSLDDVGSSARGLGQALAGLGVKGGVPGILALAAAAAIAAAPLAALGSALADLAGFAVALPAAAGLAAASIIPLTLAFQNFGDAVSAVASGDLEKIDEAMKKLAPSARSVAKEIGSLLPSLRALQRNAQQAFFAPLRGDLTAITNNLFPALNKGVQGVAGAFGNLASEVAKFFAAPARIKLINDTFEITKGLVNSLTPVVIKLFGALEAAAAAILPRLDDMAFAVQGLIGDFADWLMEAAKSGKLAEFFDDAVATLKELVGLGKAVGRLLGAVFGDLDDSGRGLIGTLTEIVDKWTAFFESAEGQKAIQDAIKTVENFGDALMFISDVFIDIEKAGIQVQEFWKGVGEWFSNLGSGISDGFGDAKDAVGTFVTDAIAWISSLPGKIGEWLSSLPGLFSKWVNDAFDAALVTIGVGIGLVIVAVTRLPGLIMDGVKALPGILGSFFSNLWENIKSGAVTAFDAIVGFVKELPGKMLDAGKAVVSAVTGFFSRAFTGAKDMASAAINNIIGFVKALPGRLTGFVKDIGGQLATVFKNLLNRAISKINEGLSRVDSFVPGNLPRIPSLADGGIASATPGGRIVRVAEAGQAEAIAPLDKLMGMIQAAVGGGGITFAPGAISVQFDGAVPTPQQAFGVGQSIGEGISNTLMRRNTRAQVRTI